MSIIKAFKNIGEGVNDDSPYTHSQANDFQKSSGGKELTVNSSKCTKSSISFIFIYLSKCDSTKIVLTICQQKQPLRTVLQNSYSAPVVKTENI